MLVTTGVEETLFSGNKFGTTFIKLLRVEMLIKSQPVFHDLIKIASLVFDLCSHSQTLD